MATATVDVEPTVVADVATASLALADSMNAASSQAKQLNSSDKAFGMLCGLIIRPLFDKTAKKAADMLSQTASTCTSVAKMYSTAGTDYSQLEQNLTTMYNKMEAC
ncbi:MAG: hypothetical protein LBM66_05470 [Bifidobacteriaceae bacterium]|jgi:hypothetical protein|nr:hypothetical protein [Bifidobacteriaceae bacterium]